MSNTSTLAKALAAGALMAVASAGVANAKPNDQLTLAEGTPDDIAASFAEWTEGARLSGRKDKCYGIALTGENDCKAGAGTSCQGSSTTDFQADAWTYAPKGSCEFIVTPNGAASLDPITSDDA
ncbi:MAG: DUF2282 domain-containing protein [Hyphomonadaceae bacterium]